MQSKTTLIYETVHGSRAYGLDGPDSDWDLKGIIVGPAIWYHGYQAPPDQIEKSADHVCYELRKFFRLSAAGNPTANELLWTDPSDHRTVTAIGEKLLEAREDFLSLRMQSTFVGYAMSQLKRIKTHRSWLMSPPLKEPMRADFGLPDHTVIPKDQLSAAEVLAGEGKINEAELSPNFLEIMKRERGYRSARRSWEQYHAWKKNRNSARAALEEKFGYDTKHAQHLVRMLRMGTEIIATGIVKVRRDDAEDLRSIRAGALSYDELIEITEQLEARVHELSKNSPLPDSPDEEKLNTLCATLIEEVHRCH